MHAAIITGVSRGLGEALAAQLLTRGWTVIGVGRKSAARLRGERYRFVNADLADVDAIEGKLSPPLTELATSSPSTVVCVNNAAVAGPIGIGGRIPHREIAASFAVNLVAPAAIANVFCRIFTDARQDRRIVNISSGAAQTPLPADANAGRRAGRRRHSHHRASSRDYRYGDADDDALTLGRRAADCGDVQGISRAAAAGRS